MSIKRTILQIIPLQNLPGWESRLVLLEYPPSTKAPLHRHPVAATGFVLEGEVLSQWEGGEIERYSTGDSFIDHGLTLHVRSENLSNDKPLKLLCNYVIQTGQANVYQDS